VAAAPAAAAAACKGRQRGSAMITVNVQVG
jgi:hypothetical protein